MKFLPLATIMRLVLVLLFFLCFCGAQDCGKSQISRTIIVDQSGKTGFRTVQAAIDSIAVNNNQWVKIQINAGIYKEKVQIPREKPCIYLEGRGMDVTTITYNDHQQTDQSATFTSSPSNIVAKGITFKNSFNVAAMVSDEERTNGGKVVPAVAARIYGDKSAFLSCKFVGFQDTLWDVQGRHYFKYCYIEGAADFIFGSGQSYYEDCMINATSWGYITAQARQRGNDTDGFVFRRGTVVGATSNVQTLLGRAYGPFSTVIFHETSLGSVVQPEGWNAWDFTTHEENFTYAEVDCKGPGANTRKRVPWMKKINAKQLLQFSRSSFIDQDGWLAKLPIYIH